MRAIPLIGILFCAYAFANGSPEWAVQSHVEDGKYHYFVGRGQGPTEAEAFAEARSDAAQTAIRELFGFSTRIYSRATESIEAVNYQSNRAELSRSVRFKGFSEYKSQSSKSDGVYQAWVQYRYSKMDAIAERDRLSKIPDNTEVPIGLVQVQTGDGTMKLPASGSYRKSDLPTAEQMYRDFRDNKNSVTLSIMGLEYQRQLLENVGINIVVSPGTLIDKQPSSSDGRYGNNFSHDLSLGVNLRTGELGYPLFVFVTGFGGATKVRSESKTYTHYGYEVGAQYLLGGNYGLTTSYIQKFGVDKGPYINAYDGIFNFGLVFKW